MGLRKRYETAEDIPEALRSVYRKEGSGYVLDMDDGDDGDDGDAKKRLKDFRANNLKLAAELKAREADLEGLRKRLGIIGDNDDDTVASALGLLSRVNDEADRELLKAGRYDEVLARRSKTSEAAWQKKLEAEQAARRKEAEAGAKARAMAADMVLERKLRGLLAEKKMRLRTAAEDDLMMRARRDWKIEDLDGEPQPANEGGAENLGAWLDKLGTEKSHWWEGGEGGGAKGGSGKGEGGVRVVKRSDLNSIEFGQLAPEIQAGRVRVVQ